MFDEFQDKSSNHNSLNPEISRNQDENEKIKIQMDPNLFGGEMKLNDFIGNAKQDEIVKE